MKILIVEDDKGKRDEIVEFVHSLGVGRDRVETAADMAEFMRKFDDQISICLIDLLLPAYEGAGPDRNGIGIIQAFDSAGGRPVKLLAISAYPEEFADVRGQFESRGCLLVSFQEKDVWKGVLKQMVIEAQAAETMDFLVFCALRSERAPFTGMPDLRGAPRFSENLSRFDISIAGRKGTVIELPRMGLVDAAVVAGRCMEKFKPKVVAMSGICAGFPGRAELGQLLVPDLAYEYQSGKWTTDGFSLEPYQVPLSENMRVLTRGILEDSGLLARLEAGWTSDRPSKMSTPKHAVFTSGSAVIASDDLIEQVSNHHRRVSGLDMEVYGVFRAAHVAQCKPEFVCAKTVVDLAGADKNDLLQPYGCTISARFIVEVLSRYFGDGVELH